MASIPPLLKYSFWKCSHGGLQNMVLLAGLCDCLVPLAGLGDSMLGQLSNNFSKTAMARFTKSPSKWNWYGSHFQIVMRSSYYGELTLLKSGTTTSDNSKQVFDNNETFYNMAHRCISQKIRWNNVFLLQENYVRMGHEICFVVTATLIFQHCT